MAKKIVCALLIALIALGLVVRVRYLLLGVPLWNDEALLAENILGRTMGGMLTPPLDNLQTAPALYLIVVKTLTLLFGGSEAVLRLFSFISFVIMLATQGILLHKVFKVRTVFTLFSLALSSVFLYFVQYSAELKPYMGDAAFVLVVILSFYAYREGMLGEGIRKALIFSGILIACMLLSSPAVFAAGAVFAVEFIIGAVQKNKRALLLVVLTGAIFIAAFILNYFLWLKPIATDGSMVWYWSEMKLSLSMSRNFALLKDLFDPLGVFALAAIPFAVAGFVISLKRRNVYTAAIGVFFIVLLVASSIDKYPIQNRLWMFLFVIMFIYIYIFIDAIRIEIGPKVVQKLIPLILAVVFLLPNVAFSDFATGEEWTLTPGNQADKLIEYVQENIRDGEIMYSNMAANPILKFKNGYHTNKIGNVSGDNIIFGTKQYWEDVDRVAEAARGSGAFVLYYHSYYPLSMNSEIRKQAFLFSEKGYFEQVMNVSETLLYWFTDDISRVRSMASVTVQDGVVTIKNTGTSILSAGMPDGYIEPDEEVNYGRVYVALMKPNDMIFAGELTQPLEPGASVDIEIDLSTLEPGTYILDLVAYDMFAFSELGMAQARLVVN